MLAMLRDQPEETADMKVLDSITLKDLDYDTIVDTVIDIWLINQGTRGKN